MRDTRPPAQDTCGLVMAVLRARPPEQVISLVLSASSSRGRPSLLETLRSDALEAHCRIALAETRGVAVRWIDGIVSGTVEDVAMFLASSAPTLARCHGRAELAAA